MTIWWFGPSCQESSQIVTSMCRVDNGMLTIAAECQESDQEKVGGGYRSEFRYGSFVRQVQLPAGTSPEVVSAAYKDGVLEPRMPKSTQEHAPHRVEIQRA